MVTCPSTLPLLIHQVRPALTASLSFSIPAAKHWSSGRWLCSSLRKPGVKALSCARAEHLAKLLVRMTRNKIASLARKQRARPADQRRVEDSGLEEKILAPAPSPSTVVAQRELLQEVQRRLSAQEQQLVSLRIEGHAWPAIAEQLGGTPEARRMQLTRALDRVEQQLGID